MTAEVVFGSGSSTKVRFLLNACAPRNATNQPSSRC